MENLVPHNTPPPTPEDSHWHIRLEGNPDQLNEIIQHERIYEQNVYRGVTWVEECEIIICLKWIDKGIRNQVQDEIMDKWPNVTIKTNRREKACTAHMNV